VSLFDKFREKLKKVAEQGEEMVRDQKTRFDISSVRRKKTELFTRLGEEIYKRELKSQAYEDLVRSYMEELRELDREIAEREAAAREGREPDTGTLEDIDITLGGDDEEQEYEPIDIELGEERPLAAAAPTEQAEEQAESSTDAGDGRSDDAQTEQRGT
jgi:hypothetical protein